MKLFRLEVLNPEEDHYNDLLLDSMKRIPSRDDHSHFPKTFAFEETGKHLDSDLNFIAFLESTLLPLFEKQPQYDAAFILKRLLYHFFKNNPESGKSILARVKALRNSENEAVINIGKNLEEHFKTGSMVFIAAEAEPFSKSGGLANVVFELPKKLAEMGERTCVIVPMYRNGAAPAMEKQRRMIETYGITYIGKNVRFMIAGAHYEVGVHSGRVNGVTYYMLDHHEFFAGLYWGYTGFEKVRHRTAFSRACAEVITTFHLHPFFVFSNEAFTGIFNGIVRSDPVYARHPDFSRTHFLFVIHNGGWQYFDAFHRFENGMDLYSLLNLPPQYLDKFLDPYNPAKLNLMATGIRFSDRVLTVSPSYARQIEVACDGLEHLLHNVIGISNAIDADFYQKVTRRVRETHFVDTYLPELKARVDADGELRKKL